MSFAAFHLRAQAALGLRLPVTLWPLHAANSGAARPRLMQTRRGAGDRRADQAGESGAAPAKVNLGELQKINTKPQVVFEAMVSDHRVVRESAKLGDWNAKRAEPLARNGAGLRRLCRLGSKRCGQQWQHLC